MILKKWIDIYLKNTVTDQVTYNIKILHINIVKIESMPVELLIE